METGWYIVTRVKGKRLLQGPYEAEELFHGALGGRLKPTTTLVHPELTGQRRIYAMQLPMLQDAFHSRARAYKFDGGYMQSGINAITFIAIVVFAFFLLTM